LKKFDWFPWLLTFGLIIFFHRAFGIGFFKDDLYFLNDSRANSLSEFLLFFNPATAQGGFRPLSTQIFYFLIQNLNLDHFGIHLIMFVVFGFGLVIFYMNLLKISNSRFLARTTVLLYALSLNHVFQLYPIANFQEICLFTFLNLAFFSQLKGKHLLSIFFFVAALLSKENALFYPFIPLVLMFAKKHMKFKTKILIPSWYLGTLFILAFGFFLLIQTELASFAQNPLYALQPNLRLILNNLMWYFFWGLGLPNYLPVYVTSVFSPPLPDFYKTLATFEAKAYLTGLLLYFVLFIPVIFGLLQKSRMRWQIILGGVFCLGFFTLFIASTLPMLHKTPIRLMVSITFLAVFQGALLTFFYRQGVWQKGLVFLLIVLFVITNYYGTRVHENSSSVLLESAIYFRAREYFEARRKIIEKSSVIFIKDQPPGQTNPWGGSLKIKDTFWDQHFVHYLFPEKKIKTVYDFETERPPKNAYPIPAIKLLPV
jgi:hypothetical protein